MTVTNSTEVIAPTATAPIRETEQEFDWRQCWYPVTFVQDLPPNRPYSFSLYEEPLVLFRNQEGKLSCLTDICPHRAAKLSDGQIIDGKLECLYHGWQFGAEGECLHIPQLPEDAKIPTLACVKSFKVVEKQGIVWMWAGEAEAADEQSIPIIEDLEKPEFVIETDFMSDRPFDQTYFIENVMDPAHFPISHDGSLSNRKKAQPLEMEVMETSVQGILGRVRETRNALGNWIDLNFLAPNLVTYRYGLAKPGLYGGVAIYSLPLGKGRCRVLLRFYRNFLTWIIKLQPRWFAHWYRNRVSEEDLPFIVGAQVQIERLSQNPNSLYLPLKTSDIFVISYRKWLDKYGSTLPYYQGYSTSKDYSEKFSPRSDLLERFHRHTQICSSCSDAYRTSIRVKQTFVGMAIALTAVALLTEGRVSIVAVSAAILAVILAVVAQNVKTKFERSYTRN